MPRSLSHFRLLCARRCGMACQCAAERRTHLNITRPCSQSPWGGGRATESGAGMLWVIFLSHPLLFAWMVFSFPLRIGMSYFVIFYQHGGVSCGTSVV